MKLTTEKIMKLADAYGNALFEQALNMRTVDEAPEKAREALAAEVERVVSIPMKYRRMEFNAELEAENAQLRDQNIALDAHLTGAVLAERERCAAYVQSQDDMVPPEVIAAAIRGQK